MDLLLSISSGGISGAILVVLLRGWITERLKRSIQHEYAQKLETHKSDLNTRLQAISHENQLNQLRTSLFFDHQREAFTKILAAIARAVREWRETYDPEGGGLTETVPRDAYRAVKEAYYDHRLFLDRDCTAAIELALEFMGRSFPFDDGNGELHRRDCRGLFDSLEFLQDRLPELFQEKIGLEVVSRAKTDLALLGAIRILNRYHFAEVGLPVKGALELTDRDTPADAVRKADENMRELLAKLAKFKDYLSRDPSCFHEAASQVHRYIQMLSHVGERSDVNFIVHPGPR